MQPSALEAKVAEDATCEQPPPDGGREGGWCVISLFPNSTSAHEQVFLSNATLDCLSVRLIASSGSSENGSDPPFLPLALDRLWSPDASNLKNLESNPSKVHFFEMCEFHIVYFVQALDSRRR